MRYGLQDHNSFAAYVPMLSHAFWTALPADLQAMMTALWAENIPTYRANMVAAHERARTLMESHGVTIVDVSPDQARQVREEMLKEQDQVAKDLKVSAVDAKADGGGHRLSQKNPRRQAPPPWLHPDRGNAPNPPHR